MRQDIVGALVGVLTEADYFTVIDALGSREALQKAAFLQQKHAELQHTVAEQTKVLIQQAAPERKRYKNLKQEVLH